MFNGGGANAGILGGMAAKRYAKSDLPITQKDADAEMGASDDDDGDEDDEEDGPRSIIIDNLGASTRAVTRANNYSPRPSKVAPPIVPPLRIGSPTATSVPDTNNGGQAAQAGGSTTKQPPAKSTPSSSAKKALPVEKRRFNDPTEMDDNNGAPLMAPRDTPGNKFKSLSIKIEGGSEAPSAAPEVSVVQQHVTFGGGSKSTSSAHTPSSRLGGLISPRRSSVTPVSISEDDVAIATKVYTPKKEYMTPKSKTSGGPPNLQGLDERTAKLLLEERQRINQEFSRLRKENHELLEKLNKGKQAREENPKAAAPAPVQGAPAVKPLEPTPPPLITPRTAAAEDEAAELLRMELEIIKEHSKDQVAREATLKQELDTVRSLAEGNAATAEALRLRAEMEKIKKQHQEELSVLMKAQEIMAKERQRQGISEAPAEATNFSSTSGRPQARTGQSNNAAVSEAAAGKAATSNGPGVLGVPRILWEGGYLWKFPYTSNSVGKRRWVQIKSINGGRQGGRGGQAMVCEPLTLEWLEPEKQNKGAREVLFDDVEEVVEGHATNAFWRQVTVRGRQSVPSPDLCFSLILDDRTLDFAAETPEEAKAWKDAIKVILDQVHYERHGGELPGAPLEAPPEDASKEVTAKVKEARVKQLFGSVRLDRVDDVRRLVASGVPVDTEEAVSSDTPLLLACRLGLADMVELCLELGAKNDPHPTFGQTALQAAVSAGHVQCVAKILEAAAPTGHDRLIVNHEDPNGEAPVHVAARCGNEDVIQLLLLHGASVDAIDVQGSTCLHSTASAGHHKCLACIMDAGGDHLLEEVDVGGNTPLHLAAKAGRLECVRLLLQSAANPRPYNKGNKTPYQLAIAKGHPQVARLLYEYEKDAEDAAPPPPLTVRRSSSGSVSSVRDGSGSGPGSANLPRPQVGYQTSSDSGVASRVSGLTLSGRAGLGDSSAPLSSTTRQKTARVESTAAMSTSSLFKGLDLYAVHDPFSSTGGMQSTQQPVYQGPTAAWSTEAPTPQQHPGQQPPYLSSVPTYAQAPQQQQGAYTSHEYTAAPQQASSAWQQPQQLQPSGYQPRQYQQQQGQQLAYPPPESLSVAYTRSNSNGSTGSYSNYQGYAVSPEPYRRQGSGGKGGDGSGKRGERSSYRRMGSSKLSQDDGDMEVSYYEDEDASDYSDEDEDDNDGHQHHRHRHQQPPQRSRQRQREGERGKAATSQAVHQQGSYHQDHSSAGGYANNGSWSQASTGDSSSSYDHGQQQQQQQYYQGEYDALSHYGYGDTQASHQDGTATSSSEYGEYYDFYVGEELWRMLYSEEGYAYYLQVSTGHTQWEVPEGYVWEDTAGAEGDAAAAPSGSDDVDSKAVARSTKSPVPDSPARHFMARSPQGGANKPRSPVPGNRPPPPSGSPKMSDLPEYLGESGSLVGRLKQRQALHRLSSKGGDDEDGGSGGGDGRSGGEVVGPSQLIIPSPKAADGTAVGGPSPSGGYREFKMSGGQPLSNVRAAAVDLLEASSPPSSSSSYGAAKPPPSAQAASKQTYDDEDTRSSVTKPSSSAPPASAKQADTPPASKTAAPTSADEKDTRDDATILAPYVRMRAAGVPVQSIKHKMVMDKVAPRLVEAFEKMEPAAPKPEAKEPSESVKAPSTTTPKAAAPSSAPAPALPTVDKEAMKADPKFSKYFKMIAVGVPKGNVYAKMATEGVGPSDVDLFRVANGDAPSAAPAPAALALVVDKEALKQDPKFTKYFKMIAVGVPLPSAYAKMASEGLTEDDIKLFKAAMGEAVTPSPGAAKSPAAKKPATTGVPMLKIHWDAISPDKVSGNSVWSTTTPRAENKLDPDERKELESLFAAKPSVKTTPTSASSPRVEKKEVLLVDVKRSNNVNIGLAQFKSFGGSDNLLRAVVELDDSNLNHEKLQNLMVLLPTTSELQMVKQYQGPVNDLGNAEQFFHMVSRFPRIEPKIKAFIFKLHFGDQLREIRAICERLSHACKQIQHSEGFAAVLQRLLVVGNAMNEGTHRGGAAGFTLESLLKITQTKGVDKKTTVLDYVVRSAFEKKETLLLEFPVDLAAVGDAERLSAREVEKDIAKLKSHLDEIAVTLRSEKDNLEAAIKLEESGEATPAKTPGGRGGRSNLGDISIASLTKFTEGLEAFYYDAVEEYQALSVQSKRMQAGIRSLAEYFLEDPNTCESQSIFSTVLTFVKLFNQSKELHKRLRKAQERHQRRGSELATTPTNAGGGGSGGGSSSSSSTSSAAPGGGGGGNGGGSGAATTPTSVTRRAEERTPTRRRSAGPAGDQASEDPPSTGK